MISMLSLNDLMVTSILNVVCALKIYSLHKLLLSNRLADDMGSSPMVGA